MIDPRLGKHFLRRLRHHAEADAIDHAVEIGLLSEELRSIDGRPVRTFAPGPLAAGKPEAVIVRLVRHHLRAGGGDVQLDDAFGTFVEPSDAPSAGTTPNAAREEGNTAAPSVGHLADTGVILRAAREAAGPPRAREVATLMLLASSIEASATSIEDVLEVLRSPNPIVTMTGLVKGFEDSFMNLLTGGIVLPGTVGVCRGDELSRHNGFRFNRASDPRWRIITFEGDRLDSDSEARIDRQVGVAAESVYPILGIAESEDNLPRQLRHAARLNLICGPIDMEIIRETMRAVLGEVPEGAINHHDASMLTLTDLALAIRPGMAAGRVLTLLEDLARMRRGAQDDDDGATSDKQSGRTSGSTRAVRGNPGSGSETIKPTALAGTDADRFIPRVEHSSGYGDAKGWALALKDDLALWRAGTLAWEDMSVKLLLSGPPGTGKTTFAKALCNTLQVPLIVSSVATWMEPGYLGDVLKRMSAAFAEAEAAKPSILFIDEIDGIGRRGTHGEWDSYWDSVVNRALELLDGAAKSDGVIVVGATNNPDAIDPALLRSGRLEKHIVIPRPDTEALMGILRHHLRSDLGTVIASAPARPVQPQVGADGEKNTRPTDAGSSAPGRLPGGEARSDTIEELGDDPS